ncbi:MAG TPA: hypothetical protein VFT47_12010 [Vicinamibacterales bacterium]|nr:hypothetical protein [Vicinamibacterales bacterium]
MSDDKSRNPLEAFETITQLRLEALMQELTKRVRVVNEDALTHLVDRGVLARVARAGCCKPDGGTCCPNARPQLADGGFDPVVRK